MNNRSLITALAAAGVLAACAGTSMRSTESDDAPFGGPASVAFAADLWQAMTAAGLAGRVAKGAPKGCIACHRAAPGGDLVFNNDRF